MEDRGETGNIVVGPESSDRESLHARVLEDSGVAGLDLRWYEFEKIVRDLNSHSDRSTRPPLDPSGVDSEEVSEQLRQWPLVTNGAFSLRSS